MISARWPSQAWTEGDRGEPFARRANLLARVSKFSILALLAGLALGGCTPYLARPATPSSMLSGSGASYAEALKYVDDTRKEFDLALRKVDDLDTVSKAGVGGGLAGAGTAAAFGAKTNVVLGFLTLGALSYALSSGADPRTLGQILNAGVDNLECIEGAGEQAEGAIAGQRYALARQRGNVFGAVEKLRADILAASARPDLYASVLPRARQSLNIGEQALGTMDFRISRSPVAGEMVRATRKTIYAVNQALRERTPDIAAISRSGSILGAFYNTGNGVAASAKEGAGRIQQTFSAHDAAHPLNDVLDADQNALKQALDEAGDLTTPPISVTAISQCKAQFAAASPLTLANATPVELKAGSTVALRTISGATAVPDWQGEVPADVTWRQEIGVVFLIARPDAKTGTYSIRLVDFSGHASEPFTLKVVAAPANDGGGAQQDAGGKNGVANGENGKKPNNANNANNVGNPGGGPPPPPDRQ